MAEGGGTRDRETGLCGCVRVCDHTSLMYGVGEGGAWHIMGTRTENFPGSL